MLCKRKGISGKEGAKSSGLRLHQRLSGRGRMYVNKITLITDLDCSFPFGLHKFFVVSTFFVWAAQI